MTGHLSRRVQCVETIQNVESGLPLHGSAAVLGIACARARRRRRPSPRTKRPPSQDETEEVVIATGTQIRGADISGVLPVTVIDSEDIDALGVESGDELIGALPEQGQNLFNEEENISGGVNSARGDVGAFNLRNLGTGNTLVLLNGRRMVNAASYQTEEVGGSFVPVNTVNSNTIPVYGVERVEVLKDGASAIYGADAVAGVVNTVLKDDIDGLTVRTRYSWYDLVGRNTTDLNIEWGRDFNGGQSNIGVMFDVYNRDSISSQEDERWSDSDLRRLLSADSPWADETDFRNNSANSLYGQFDVVSSVRRLDIRNDLVDTAGEFETYPLGHENCQWTLNEHTCGAIDGQGTYRYNLNAVRDLSSELARNSLFVYVNHLADNGLELFSEIMRYRSESEMSRHPSAPFSAVKLRVGPENYYNPFGPCGSPNRLPDEVIGDVPCSGLQLYMDFYRFAELPRTVQNDGTVFRILQGARWSSQRWDWEAALLYSKATRTDLTRNRVSNSLIAEALFDSTPAAYNPFSGGNDSNIERALIDVTRDNEMVLTLFDVKASTVDLFNMPHGPVGFVAGFERRSESFEDDRDPRLDGTIRFTDYDGDTYPFVSDVVNSSPTPDSSGDRNVNSLFGEFRIPLLPDFDVQVAIRHERFSDVGNTVVGKVAGGWRLSNNLRLRGSWSEAFRAPNLVTINEEIVARQNTRNDYACIYAAENGGDPDQDIVDCRNSVQRIARGSKDLVPERSMNYSFGTVVDISELGNRHRRCMVDRERRHHRTAR